MSRLQEILDNVWFMIGQTLTRRKRDKEFCNYHTKRDYERTRK